ncbi:uncharacterized protein LOC144622803 [Crassostrea virginica]
MRPQKPKPNVSSVMWTRPDKIYLAHHQLHFKRNSSGDKSGTLRILRTYSDQGIHTGFIHFGERRKVLKITRSHYVVPSTNQNPYSSSSPLEFTGAITADRQGLWRESVGIYFIQNESQNYGMDVLWWN